MIPSFNIYITRVSSQAFKRLEYILINLNAFSDKDGFAKAFITLLRTIQEYTSIIKNYLYNKYFDWREILYRNLIKSIVFFTEGSFPPNGFPQGILLDRFHLVKLVVSLERIKNIYCTIFYLDYLIIILIIVIY